MLSISTSFLDRTSETVKIPFIPTGLVPKEGTNKTSPLLNPLPPLPFAMVAPVITLPETVIFAVAFTPLPLLVVRDTLL